ncbi:MAG: serine hydrolase, partial [Bdellovibrionales bacterium]|nr:serine hydrolase [Bdellovibrionales bacterium]
KISYETKLSDFYSIDLRNQWIEELNINLVKKNKKPIKLSINDNELYGAITLRDLVKMQAGFKWDESYSNPLGDFMAALYLSGTADIVKASLTVPMELPPGKKFNYSGGNANLIQGILQQLGVENFNTKDPNVTAHLLLFDRIGIKDAFFETDQKGSAIGSTYLHIKPKGMALLGQLYLNRGYWNDGNGNRVQILSDEFVEALSSINSAVDHADIDEKYLEYIKEEGVPSNAITWLNKPVIDSKDVIRYEQEFPSSPSDMFVLAGHNGQMIFVLPSQEMVIAITGSNKGYWDKIDKIAYSATTCFSGLKLAPDKLPNLLNPPEIEKPKSFLKKAKESVLDLSKNLSPALKLLFSNVASGAAAKELCSCMNVDIQTLDLKKAIKYCPGDLPQVVQKNYSIKTNFDEGYVEVKSMTHFFKRRARLTNYGCTLEPVE